MHRFVRNLITEWRRLGLPASGETVIVAVSGGADSVSLLLALNELRKRRKLDLEIIAAHFNHRLRGAESEADERFVRRLAVECGVQCVTGEMTRTSGGNLEQRAREKRYEFLRRSAEMTKAFGVLTAHTKNDQAETFLMNLIRGSGVSGLSGMRPIRPFDHPEVGPLLIRPLLAWATRTDTEAFCRECQVDYRSDAMNEDLRFTRVRIRKELIPKLAEFNPKIIETLARTAEMLAELEPQSGIELPETLSVREIKKLSKAELHRTIRSWLKARRGDLRRLELKHIEAIERLIHSRKSGKTVELPLSQRVIKQNGRLVFVQIMVEK